MITFMVTTTPLAGPVVSLKVQRTVSGNADIFLYARSGDVKAIELLFENGLASPHDVHHESGITPLHLAINHQNISVCKLLLQANADPFLPDYSQCAASDNAWTKIFSKCLGTEDERNLRSLFSETECIERRELSILHKIVLDIVNGDLEEQLKASTAEINSLDIIGRTPLSMAAEMSKTSLVSTLLRFGANADLPSGCGQTSIHYAASAKEPDCLALLMDAGAKVDPLTNWDQTPLHLAAAYTKDRRHADILLDAGADIDKRDRDGITPLGWTAISNNPEVAACLLERGAEINNLDSCGSSTVQQCIKSNRHEILRILASYEPSVQDSIPEDECFWTLVAEHADAETMAILLQFDLSGSLKIEDIEGDSLYQSTLENRTDNSVALTNAFERLVRSARVGADSSEDSDAEVWEDALE